VRYDHVIWDWNGTLFDDVDLVVEVANLMLSRRSIGTIDRARYQELFGFPVRGYYERVGFDLEREPFEDLSVEFIAEYNARWRDHQLRADARPTTEELHARGVTQSILSASEQDMLRTVTAYFEIDDRMTALVGIDNYHAVSKFDHGVTHVEQLPAARERVLLVGDTEHDHEVAMAIGVDCALIADGHAHRARLRATSAPTFDSLEQMLTTLH
jgi:phosphoglycolate phosphatase